ncbi:hypothetical protein H4O20_09730 [Aequorivita sp. 609]|uniref:hypothetical protein n=1 Tax=Aequorivita TaxID=153265 RepID=UPI00161CB36E|nr:MULTISPECIES: hypothetical protein [Aequorivita]MBB6681722.1 hypothetical protein [Aequorivita sp. 609]
MKTFYIILVFSLLLILGCNKEENNTPVGYPMSFDVYLDLQKPDGSPYNEGEVEAKGGFLDEEGHLIFNGDWITLPVDVEISAMLEKRVFGPFGLSIGWESGEEPEEGTEWVINNILLLLYKNISDIDTLRGRDSTRYPEFRYFDIFKNGTLLQRFNDPDNYIERPWNITIQK